MGGRDAREREGEGEGEGEMRDARGRIRDARFGSGSGVLYCVSNEQEDYDFTIAEWELS